MSVLKITTNRLGKKTDRFTTKLVCKNAATFAVRNYNTGTAIIITSVIERNDNEVKSINVELTERTLLKALKEIREFKKRYNN